jgi:hypothetical protein
MILSFTAFLTERNNTVSLGGVTPVDLKPTTAPTKDADATAADARSSLRRRGKEAFAKALRKKVQDKRSKKKKRVTLPVDLNLGGEFPNPHNESILERRVACFDLAETIREAIAPERAAKKAIAKNVLKTIRAALKRKDDKDKLKTIFQVGD